MKKTREPSPFVCPFCGGRVYFTREFDGAANHKVYFCTCRYFKRMKKLTARWQNLRTHTVKRINKLKDEIETIEVATQDLWVPGANFATYYILDLADSEDVQKGFDRK